MSRPRRHRFIWPSQDFVPILHLRLMGRSPVSWPWPCLTRFPNLDHGSRGTARDTRFRHRDRITNRSPSRSPSGAGLGLARFVTPAAATHVQAARSLGESRWVPYKVKRRGALIRDELKPMRDSHVARPWPEDLEIVSAHKQRRGSRSSLLPSRALLSDPCA